MSIEIASERFEFFFQVRRRPEQCLVQILSSNGPDQSLHKRVRQRSVRHSFDFMDFEHPKIRLPRYLTKEFREEQRDRVVCCVAGLRKG